MISPKRYLNLTKIQQKSSIFTKKLFFTHPLIFALNDNSSGRLLYNISNANAAVATQELEYLQSFTIIFRT